MPSGRCARARDTRHCPQPPRPPPAPSSRPLRQGSTRGHTHAHASGQPVGALDRRRRGAAAVVEGRLGRARPAPAAVHGAGLPPTHARQHSPPARPPARGRAPAQSSPAGRHLHLHLCTLHRRRGYRRACHARRRGAGTAGDGEHRGAARRARARETTRASRSGVAAGARLPLPAGCAAPWRTCGVAPVRAHARAGWPPGRVDGSSQG